MSAPTSSGHSLALDRVSHAFGNFLAVDDVSMDVDAGELIALLGPSGCGKTTLLRIIAGFIAQSAGRVLFDGRPVDALAPNRRNVGLVFQSYALFPHMTVAENVAYGLEARRQPRAAIGERVEEMLALVKMSAMASRFPRELSGGQQQRVALARALAVEPNVLLLDEPFGALDKNLRLDMQIEVKRLVREYGITTILVTHDQEEALSMADRIAVLNQGRVEQLDSPGTIYDRPSSVFVNRFVGTTNLVPGALERLDGAELVVALRDGVRIECAGRCDARPGDEIFLSVRPERLRVAPGDGPGIPGAVLAAMPLGPTVVYEIDIGAETPVKVARDRAPDERLIEPGAEVRIALASPGDCIVFPR